MIQSKQIQVLNSNFTQPGNRLAFATPSRESKKDINVRPIQSAHELDEVHQLTYAAYLDQGYCVLKQNGKLSHYSHLDEIPETTILVAVQNEKIVGTNTLTFDGPRGLHADVDFKSECDEIRKENRHLGSSWRIITSRECRESRQVVMALIQETVRRTIVGGLQTCVFTFNPRHERIYKRILNMTTVARTEKSNGLTNAPAVFMRWDLERCPERWLLTSDLRRIVNCSREK